MPDDTNFESDWESTDEEILPEEDASSESSFAGFNDDPIEYFTDVPPPPKSLAAPPDGQTFPTYDELWAYVETFGVQQGYAISISRSKKKSGKRTVWLKCDRGGIYECTNTVKDTTSRKVGCPFELIARQRDSYWLLEIKNSEH